MKITKKDKIFIRHKTHGKKYKGNVIQKTNKPTQQQPKPELPSTPYMTLVLKPDYPQIDNHDEESDTDLSVNTSNTEPYAEIESEWVPVVVVLNRNRERATWLNDFDTS